MSCGGDDPGPTETEDPPVATTISLSQTDITLTFLGQVFGLTASVEDQFGRPFTTTVSWSVDDATVATVAPNGRVTAVSNGSATVTAAVGDLSATTSVTVQQEAARVFLVSGDVQTATVAELLPEPLVVQSADQGGAPVPGASVTFTVEDEAGSVSAAQVTTDEDALASTTWTLGTTSGEQRLSAAIENTTTGWVWFTATAQAGPATALQKTSGDEQLGTVNVTLTQPVAVTLVDQYGNGVEGGSVTFAVTGGGGSVTPSDVTTGEDGLGEADWTMGSTVGANTLSASVPDLPAVTFTATAQAAMADLTVGDIVLDPANPTALESFTVTATVNNIGYLTTGAGFEVQLLVDGVVASTASLPTVEARSEGAAVFSAGPLTAGSHTLSVVVDAGETVEESDESNNASQRFTTVPQAAPLVAGTPVSNLSAADSVELLFLLEVGAGETGTLIVETSGGTGDLDLYVNHETRPLAREGYHCQSGGPNSNERCVFNAAEPGTYHILAFAWDAFSGVSLVASTGQDEVPYNLDLQFINRGTAGQDAAFEAAANRWNSIIRDDITGIDFSTNPLAAGSCMEGQPALNEAVDDVLIFVDIVEIDGAGGTLAQAGPCVVHPLSKLPIVGIMKFDEADLDGLENNGGLTSVVLHEMGHVLGIGTIWNSPIFGDEEPRFTRLRNPSLPNSSGADTYFDGPLTRVAFLDAGGQSTYTLGEIVPVQNDADEGSADSHWRESVLEEELMTPFINTAQTNPLSAISIMSLGDVGYRVDVSKADPYRQSYRAPPRLAAEGTAIDLRGDLRRGPVFVMGKDGRLREVVRR
jgi:hypothetical protein